MTSPTESPEVLPKPDEAAQAHSQQLSKVICAEIEHKGGAISFARFMERALYAPGLGYYSAGARKFGEQGDFITAPELSDLFSHCVARQCRQVLAIIDNPSIVEFGAGSGRMACAILKELERLDALPVSYLIVEVSADLRERQQALIKQQLPEFIDRVHWLESLPATFKGVVLANEVLDALPVRRFHINGNSINEMCVGYENDQFVWSAQPADDDLVKTVNTIQDVLYEKMSDGYTSEVCMVANAWIKSVADTLDEGAVLLIDYGYPRHEYYHPQRTDGSLMCYYQHRRHSDPLKLIGLQDITAHVDFTSIAEAANQAGLVVAGFTTQACFLLGNGLDEMVASSDLDNQRAHLRLMQQVKRLTLPGEMGELFKVMALTRSVDEPLKGFTLKDYRGRL